MTSCTLQNSALLKPPLDDFALHYAEKGLEYERYRELHKALLCWNIVARFHPDNQRVVQKIADLKAEIARLSDIHFNRGTACYRNGLLRKARQEFLLCLACDPNNMAAADFLRKDLQEKVYSYHVIREEDTLQDIAEEAYGSRRNEFLIAYFNDLDHKTELVPGVRLQLPLSAVIPTGDPDKTVTPGTEPGKRSSVYLDQLMSQAEYFFTHEEYEKAMTTAQKVLDHDITNKRAIQFFEQMEIEAEKHYRRGIKYFLNEKIGQSIIEWETAFILNPDHEKARLNIEKAQYLIKKFKELQ
jgi:tetratricopeptide (TPR) repeat protein